MSGPINDPFDRRIQKTNSPAVGPADIEQYAYDGPHIALRFDNGTLANRYLHGPAIDQILADEQLDLNTGQTEQLLWPLADNLGTVRDLAEYDDATGITSIANHLAYDSFGQVTSETNSTIDHLFAYTGRERDEESDLYYYRARYYDPAVGRFTSEDPIGFVAGDVNLSRYVGNGATTKIDPSGLDDESANKSGPVGAFPGTLDDLTVDQIALLVGDEEYYIKEGPQLTGGGRGILIRGNNGNAIWFVPMLGVNADGDIIRKGTFVFDDYNSACVQARKNHELAWLAAFGQSLRDVAATMEIGTLPPAGKAIARTAWLLAARRAARAADALRWPAGLSKESFEEMSSLLRRRLKETAQYGDLGDDIVVQGGRAAGRTSGDIDIGIRVSAEKFNELIEARLKTLTPGSDTWKTLMMAKERGRIHAGEIGISGVRKEIQRMLGIETDLSVILSGGPFDNLPCIPVN